MSKQYKRKFPDPEILDPEIRELIKLLNEFPFLETISSCQGHPERAAPLRISFRISEEVPWLKLCSYVQNQLAKKEVHLEVAHRLFFQTYQSFWEWRIDLIIPDEKLETYLKKGAQVLTQSVREFLYRWKMIEERLG